MSDDHLSIEERLTALQERDLSGLGRRDELGQHHHLNEAVPPLEKTQGVFKELPPDLLKILSETMRRTVDQVLAQFEQDLADVEAFDPTGENAVGRRNDLIARAENSFPRTFDKLHPAISYVAARRTDFKALDREAREFLKDLEGRVEEFEQAIGEVRTEIDEVLDRVRKAAAEQGVSQQAAYFKTVADDEQKLADKWGQRTLWALGVFIAITFFGAFSYNWGWFGYDSNYPVALYISARVVLFFGLAFAVVTAARNYHAHKHNVTVNRQRQTSLQTFKVLADAAKSPADRDVILTHAAACIFQPQDTGFVRSTQDNSMGGQSVIEILRSAQSQSTPG